MLIYRAQISGKEARVGRLRIKNKIALSNILNGTAETDHSLDDSTETIPHGDLFSATQKGVLRKVEETFEYHGFEPEDCTISKNINTIQINSTTER